MSSHLGSSSINAADAAKTPEVRASDAKVMDARQYVTLRQTHTYLGSGQHRHDVYSLNRNTEDAIQATIVIWNRDGSRHKTLISRMEPGKEVRAGWYGGPIELNATVEGATFQ
jgi:hypothetical protein